MAFAIASGAKPEQGLYTAIVAGFATSLLGDSRVQISGATGAFIAVLADITAQYGIDGLQVATLMARPVLWRAWANGNEGLEGVTLPATALVYRIDGLFFFGAAEELESTLERVQLHVETIVIRLGRVPFMDATGLQTLSEIIRTSVPTCARWCGRSVVHTKLLEALGAKLALAGLFRQAAIQNQDIRMQK